MLPIFGNFENSDFESTTDAVPIEHVSSSVILLFLRQSFGVINHRIYIKRGIVIILYYYYNSANRSPPTRESTWTVKS